MSDSRPLPGIPKEVQKREGAALKRIWDRNPPMAQAEFATKILDRSAGYLPQFFKGLRPLTLEFARLFAEHLKCGIDEFSPRLHEEDLISRQLVRWPFPTLAFASIESLEPWEVAELEGVMRGYLIRRHSDEQVQRGRQSPKTKS